MKNSIISGILLSALLFAMSCEKEELNNHIVSGTGEVVTRTLELATFTDITLEGVANLYVSLGGEQSVTMKAQQNIMDVMFWEVTAGNLTIGTDENVTLQNHEEIRFEIEVQDLYSLVHSGVGDVILNGSTRTAFEIDFQGVGDILAYELPADKCTVYSNGVGDCKVQVNNQLEAVISGIGNIYYRGTPQINITDTGLGELIDDN